LDFYQPVPPGFFGYVSVDYVNVGRMIADRFGLNGIAIGLNASSYRLFVLRTVGWSLA